MKVIIAGSRTINNFELVGQCMKYANKEGLWANEVVSGGANGVDKLGEKLAKSWNWKLTIFPADWHTHGKSAGFIRNKQMAEYADWLLAIWDGQSKGTAHMIETMKTLNKPVFVYIVKC